MPVECRDGGQCTWMEEHFHRLLSVGLPHRMRRWIHDYKGFLSQEDGYLDYSEWHVSVWSAGLAVATFVLHELFAGLYVLITVRVIREKPPKGSSLSEIDGELPYWFLVFIAVSAVLMGMGYSADFGTLLKTLPLLGL